MIHVGEVVEHVECEIDVDLVQRVVLLAELTDFLLLGSRLLGLNQSLIKVFLDFRLS